MTELIMSGVELMLIGMGIVFLFLAMLIFAVNLMTTLVLRYFPELPATMPTPITKTANDNTIAAITVAVTRYRQDHK
jgi:oxaloacetate decarboxylase gamma subunit